MRTSDRDTIVAVATAPGEGAIGIVRLSGPQAVSVASCCFRGSQALHDADDRRLTLGRLVVGDQDLDEVLVSVMRAPETYTGEDVVEFNCHGGPLLLRRAVEALIGAGARLAERGEFTRRAFLNGKLDLTQAEAVADMVQAKGEFGLESAYFQLRGGLRSRFTSLAEDLRKALAVVEAGLDFAEDLDGELPGVGPTVLSTSEEVDRLIRSYRMGKMVREGATVVICGKPNVGKSSLLNRLLEQDRAIVTPIPGTTRDTIEESIVLDGVPVILVDTAGIRESGDPIEMEGARRSLRSVEEADRVLLVVDGVEPPDGEDGRLLKTLKGRPSLLVVNKIDLGTDPGWSDTGREWDRVRTSALTGEGVEALREALGRALRGQPVAGRELVTHGRHLIALRRAREGLSRAEAALRDALPGEVVAVELREALEALGDIVGETASEDILDRIFETFCIGK